MEISIEYLDNLTPAQIDAIEEGKRLLEEARRDVKAFMDSKLFRPGEYCVELPSSITTVNNAEFVLHSGVWQRQSNARKYELALTDEAVFDAYRKAAKPNADDILKANVAAFKARAQWLRKKDIGND